MSAEPRNNSLLPTRERLLTRRRDWQDQENGRESIAAHGHLIHNVAHKSTQFALVILLAAAWPAVADYRLDVWTADSGLPQNSVRGILQSADGYLWVATQDGLARFDGVRFTTFNKANTPGISNNRIRTLYEDRERDLWIGLDDGHLVRLHRGTFTPMGIADGLSGASIQTIAGGEHGSLWVSADDTPFYRKNGRFQPDPVARAALPPRDLIRGCRAGILWTTNAGGLQIISRGTVTTLGLSNGLPTSRINHVDEDQHGNWWVATEDAGLLKVRDGKVVKSYTQQDGLPSNRLFTRSGSMSPSVASEDRNGNLWVTGAGPWLGRLKDGIFTAYPSTDALTPETLPLLPGQLASFINVLFEDREGNLWIGTEGCGLIRAREQKVSVLAIKQGLRAANIYPIFEDRAEAVWLGTWNLGLARVKDGVVTNFTLRFPYGDVTAIHEDRAGRLWVGTMGGPFVFQQEQISLAEVPMALTNQPVRAICEDRDGVLWFGAESGLFSYQNGNLKLYTEQDGVAKGYVTAIIEDRQGRLWFGSRAGLTQLANGRFTTWTERDGLPSNRVGALHEDGEGILWVGTADGGLARFQEGRFTRYTTKEGMFDNGVFQILEDAEGIFWMSSNRGIHRVSKQELNEFAAGRRSAITSIAYGKGDGMLNPECNGGCWPSGVKSRDGKLWFPTQDGVAIIDPERVPANTKPPPVVIEAFLLDRQPRALDSPVRVPPRHANIEIHYAGLSFVNSERLLFKYRLAGSDEDWVEAGTRRTAYYSHLAPRHYVFTVLAANSDGVWNETGAAITFIVEPHLWQTTWFRALVSVAVLGLITGWVWRRMKGIEQRQQAQEAFSRRLLEQTEIERRRIAAELHDGLGQNLVLVKNLALMDQLGGSTEKSSPQSSQLAEAAGRALEEVHAISYALRPPELDRLGLAKALAGMVRRSGDASGIRFETHFDLDGDLPAGMDIQLFRVAQEAVNNLVKHSGAKSARVELWRDEGGVHLVVADDGRGLALAPDKPKSGTGLGLTGIEERVRLIGGHCKWLSQSGQGTTLSVLVPLNVGS